VGIRPLVVFNGGTREASPTLQRVITTLIEDAKTPELFQMMQIWMNLARLEDVCLWLVKNGITGWRLHNWYITDCQRSPLEAARFVLSKINKNPKQGIMFGSDWLA
jgi:hypothetical protein